MHETIRCFIAVNLPQELKEDLQEYINALKIQVPKVKWVRAQALHITLKFLGPVPAETLQTVQDKLTGSRRGIESFRMVVSNFGAFPNRRKPRVIWLGLKAVPQQPLYQLHSQIDALMEPLGFEREKRRFSPHLTLGRVKFPLDMTGLWDYMTSEPFPEYTFDVSEFALMKSTLKPSGAEYATLQKYSLQTP